VSAFADALRGQVADATPDLPACLGMTTTPLSESSDIELRRRRQSGQLKDRGADHACAGVGGMTVAEVELIAFGIDDTVGDRFGARLAESVVMPTS
jgi:hypothetical protein